MNAPEEPANEEKPSHTTLEALGSAILERCQTSNAEDVDIFDHYTKHLQSKIFSRGDFIARIEKGYEMLKQTMKDQG
jgi:hypothetical protein